MKAFICLLLLTLINSVYSQQIKVKVRSAYDLSTPDSIEVAIDKGINQFKGITDTTGECTLILTDVENQKPIAWQHSSSWPYSKDNSIFIKYNLIQQADLEITVYDVLGQQVEKITRLNQSAGLGEAQLHSRLANGFYPYQIKTGNEILTGGFLNIEGTIRTASNGIVNKGTTSAILAKSNTDTIKITITDLKKWRFHTYENNSIEINTDTTINKNLWDIRRLEYGSESTSLDYWQYLEKIWMYPDNIFSKPYTPIEIQLTNTPPEGYLQGQKEAIQTYNDSTEMELLKLVNKFSATEYITRIQVTYKNRSNMGGQDGRTDVTELYSNNVPKLVWVSIANDLTPEVARKVMLHEIYWTLIGGSGGVGSPDGHHITHVGTSENLGILSSDDVHTAKCMQNVDRLERIANYKPATSEQLEAFDHHNKSKNHKGRLNHP